MAKPTVAFLAVLFLVAIAMPKVYGNVEGAEDEDWYHETFQGNFKLKTTKLHFYIQDVLMGPNATVHAVAQADITASSSTTFGKVSVIDDLLTVKPDASSKKIGRAQGIIANIDLSETALQTILTLVFTTGKLNGSTLVIVGRNPVLHEVREVPIVSGTGVFQLARGFVKTSTYSFDPITNYGILEYNAEVSYYEQNGKHSYF